MNPRASGDEVCFLRSATTSPVCHSVGHLRLIVRDETLRPLSGFVNIFLLCDLNQMVRACYVLKNRDGNVAAFPNLNASVWRLRGFFEP